VASAYPSKEDVIGRNVRHFTAREDVGTMFDLEKIPLAIEG
jgi:hypothetical protein